VGCFFVHTQEIWQNLMKTNSERRALREGEIALLWPPKGGDQVWEGATVIIVNHSTVIRTWADYDDNVDIWRFAAADADLDPATGDWQRIKKTGVECSLLANEITAFHNCGGQACGGRW